MRIFWPAAKSGAPPWTSKRAFISAPYQWGMRCGTKKTKISLGVVEIWVASSMRDILMERYLMDSEWCEEVKRFNTECTGESGEHRESGRDPSTGLEQRRRPPFAKSLRAGRMTMLIASSEAPRTQRKTKASRRPC